MVVLDRDAILSAARALAERHGVAALTMRAVAEQLHVTAAALYYHFPNKSALVGALVDQLVNETLLAAAGGETWQEEARRLATAVKDLGVTHPEWMGILLDAQRRSPAVLALHEAGTRIFLRAGFTPDLATHGYRAIMRFVVGHVGVSAGGETTSHPRHAAPTDPHGPGSFDPEQNFGFGLDLLIEGLERRHADAARSRDP